MSNFHTTNTDAFEKLHLEPMLLRQETKQPMETPSKKRKLNIPKTPETVKDSKSPIEPGTVIVGDDGKELAGQEELHRKHDEYNKTRKYKMVPYNLPVNLHDVFVKQPDGTFEPLIIKGKTFLLGAMNEHDFHHGIQAYDYEGNKMKSDNLFGTSSSAASLGGSKKRRKTRRRSSKRKHNKSKKMRK